MRKNILIIDDSALMRRVTSDIIEADARFKVVASASNGYEAYKLITSAKEKYDAAILDINMPVMDGIELLKKLENEHIHLKVIISSNLAKEGADETVQALEHGAFDFITKPVTYSQCKNTIFADNLLSKLAAACGIHKEDSDDLDIKQIIEAEKILESKHNNKDKKKKTETKNKSKLVIIAASTGGPRALQRIIPMLPQNIDAPIVVIQHMPEGFTASLAYRLAETSSVRVKEAEDGDKLEKGVVYIAKGGSQLKLMKSLSGMTHLVLEKDEDAILKPCADVTIASAAMTEYSNIICAVLTGMGSDATRGILKLRETKNVQIIAQNESTSVVYGMPKVIAATGLVNDILPLDDIADKIINNTGVR